MKIRITFKDPDAVSYALDDLEHLIREELKAKGITDAGEIESVVKTRKDKIHAEVSKHFAYGEYAALEYDTETKEMKLV